MKVVVDICNMSLIIPGIFLYRIFLCRIRLLSTQISKIIWLESGLPLKIMFSTQSIFANPLFGISTRMDPSFSHKSSLESEKVEKNENLVAFLVGLVSGYANICSNGGLIILKLMLKLLMRPSNASLPNEIIELYILDVGKTYF